MTSRARKNSGRKRRLPSTNVDRLGNLPESILCHILSFLPTKDAVASSLVSKRWKFLWTNIHVLMFSDYDDSTRWLNERHAKERKIKFAHFVNKVLLSLNHQTIHKFSLGIESSCEVYDVTTWIATAVARNVKVLEFFLLSTYFFSNYSFSDPHNKFPCSLFTCKSLEVLVLNGMMNLNVPSLVCLPNLKTMRLNNVIFQCDESFRNLVSGCSSLQTLYVGRHVYDNVVTFTISSPTLTNLTFRFREHTIDIEQHGFKLEINAPALTYFYLDDCLSRNFSVESLCSLDKADIYLYFGGPINDYDHYSKAVVKLLRGVCNVKELYLRRNAFEALISHAGPLPSFWRLTQLYVQTGYCGWNSLLELVKASNKLKFLTFDQFFGNTKDEHVTCWSKPDKVPICFLSCFERMSILRVKGLEDELAMIAYILKKATVLRTMTIQAAFHLDVEAKFKLFQKISKFPRGSKKCEITFS